MGISGINAVAEILTGKVNPSGSLVDTYCYDNFSAPAMWNFTPTIYEGYVEGGDVSAKAKSYMIYQEGIYVGYKYYETRYEDFVTGNATQATTLRRHRGLPLRLRHELHQLRHQRHERQLQCRR